jgi:hypothetical protein
LKITPSVRLLLELGVDDTANTVLGLRGSIASVPTNFADRPVLTGLQLRPASLLLKTPNPLVPA